MKKTLVDSSLLLQNHFKTNNLSSCRKMIKYSCMSPERACFQQKFKTNCTLHGKSNALCERVNVVSVVAGILYRLSSSNSSTPPLTAMDPPRTLPPLPAPPSREESILTREIAPSSLTRNPREDRGLSQTGKPLMGTSSYTVGECTKVKLELQRST